MIFILEAVASQCGSCVKNICVPTYHQIFEDEDRNCEGGRVLTIHKDCSRLPDRRCRSIKSIIMQGRPYVTEGRALSSGLEGMSAFDGKYIEALVIEVTQNV